MHQDPRTPPSGLSFDRRASLQEIIARAPWFADLSSQDATALIASLQSMSCASGTVVYRQDDQGDALYVVLSGTVKLARTEIDGRRRMLSLMGPGDAFGELALFDPGRRADTATVIASSELVTLTNEALQRWMGSRPEVGFQLLQVLARRLREQSDVVSDLLYRDATSRFARVVLSLSQRFGMPASAGVFVGHGLTQSELAQLAATSREVVNRALADFASEGWVKVEGMAFTVLDPEAIDRRSRELAVRPSGPARHPRGLESSRLSRA